MPKFGTVVYIAVCAGLVFWAFTDYDGLSKAAYPVAIGIVALIVIEDRIVRPLKTEILDLKLLIERLQRQLER